MKLVVACVLLFTTVAAGQCANAACFGPTGTDPLVISGNWTVLAGANLDFGPRHVILATGATLLLGGPASIAAAKFTAQTGSTIAGTAVPESDLSITTIPAGPHDGSATLSGTTDLNGWASGNLQYQSGGSFTLNAGGAASVNSLDTSSGIPGDVGDITINAPAITIGTILASTNEYFSQAGVITLTSTGPVTVGSITALSSPFSSATQVTISGSSYTQNGDVLASACENCCCGNSAAQVTINVAGPASIQGQIRTGEPSSDYGGAIGVIAGGAISWTSAVGFASGQRAGNITLQSLGSDVLFAGSLVARAEGDYDDGGGYISISAAGQLDFTGMLDVSTAQTLSVFGTAPSASLTAGRTLRVHAGSVVQARDIAGGCTSFGGFLSLNGCRVVIEAGATVATCGNHPFAGPSVSVGTRDLLTVDGTISAGGAPGQMYPAQVLASSRLPWQAALAGSGTIVPPPIVTVSPALGACAAESTLVTAPSPVTAGQSITLSVTSQPMRSLLIVGDLSIVHLSLGSLGWTQVNVFTAYRIADDLAVLGPQIPAVTDANGSWSWSVVTPVAPVLSNADVYFDVYVIDSASLNGLFQQAPAVIHFN